MKIFQWNVKIANSQFLTQILEDKQNSEGYGYQKIAGFFNVCALDFQFTNENEEVFDTNS